MTRMRSFPRTWGVVALSCLVACSGPAATSTSTGTSPTTSVKSAHPSTTNPSTSQPSTTSSAQASTGSVAQQRYLAHARIYLPHANQAALIATARSICATIRTGSQDDAVGELAAQIGNQPAAYQLVTLATDAYCPQPSH